MSDVPQHPREPARIAAIKALDILDTPPEADFDDIVQLCAEVFEAPISLITIIEEERQWFKAKVGLQLDETPREIAFCTHCILQDGIFEIEDTLKDPRVADNPLVTDEPRIRSYAGAPIWTKDGFPIGSLCVINTKPTKLTDFQRRTLRILANQVSRQIELRVANTQLREATLEARAHQESLQQMIRLIGHDLRNPIGGLASMLNLLSTDYEKFTDDEAKDMIVTMNASSNQAFALLENLLEWSSAEAGMIDLQLETRRLAQIANDVLETVAPLIDAKSLQVSCKIPETLLVNLDKRMIASVFRNLLTNAIKFSNSGGRIELNAEIDEDRARILVRDFGIGMEANQVEAILNKTSSASTHGTSGETGMGIGLSLVHNFLRKHGTELHVESAPDAGTTASFELPIKEVP